MTPIEYIFFILLPSGLMGALAAAIVNHFFNKKFDSYKRMMDVRKESYTKINEIFSAFYSTVDDKISDKASAEMLQLYREIQLWGSDEVIRSFQKLIFALNVENKISQEERNLTYKEFVVSMRKDIIGETDIKAGELEIHGLINRK